MEEDGLQNWRDVLASNPEAQPGLHNPRRQDLLQPGVYFDASREKAESWIPTLRVEREMAEAAARAKGETMPTIKEPVRVTIVRMPDEVQGKASGTIYVEVEGKEYTVDSSLLAHSIGQPTDTPVFDTHYSVQGFNYEPTGGENGSGWSHN